MEFESRFPQVRMVVRQVATRPNVIAAVQSGDADIGLCSLKCDTPPEGLHAEPVYDLEVVLLVPHGHPLARVRIRWEHFAQYPLLNVRGIYADWGISSALEQVGAFQHPERRVELEMARSIRLYVRNGLGIGIVVRPKGMKSDADLIERPLNHLVTEPMKMFAFYRTRVAPDPALLDFLQVVRETLSSNK
ncbi:MAG: hypothetical protein KatS3mg114_0553 [Planctomycetaceae bacterium]|nr:MAG: hypothetical protein KatS3mg114_0553 [Planctomycetaceae bacterium]